MVIVGAIIVIVSVLGGFVAHHGNVLVLNQPTEFVIIFGAALGSLITSNSTPQIKHIIHLVLLSLKQKPKTKEEYLELLMCLYELCKVVKTNPLSLEPHVEKPESSDIFKRYPGVLANHHALDFICDTLKVQISSPMSPYDLEDLMDKDMRSHHEEENHVPHTVNKIGDAMPGLGIVAAVLGVVITMGALSEGKEAIGHNVAAALVGTFIGILGSYGFMGPLAAKIEANIVDDAKYVDVIKSAILALSKECAPKVCVEFARRTVPPGARPSFDEVDKATSSTGSVARAA
ncbi:MAG: flagellar motor stator protein MotA [Bdellovibrionales bacterium]|nr:flagellar motor stator protein MotA [Bdellovibrionales bacterium]